MVEQPAKLVSKAATASTSDVPRQPFPGDSFSAVPALVAWLVALVHVVDVENIVSTPRKSFNADVISVTTQRRIYER